MLLKLAVVFPALVAVGFAGLAFEMYCRYSKTSKGAVRTSAVQGGRRELITLLAMAAIIAVFFDTAYLIDRFVE